MTSAYAKSFTKHLKRNVKIGNFPSSTEGNPKCLASIRQNHGSTGINWKDKVRLVDCDADRIYGKKLLWNIKGNSKTSSNIAFGDFPDELKTTDGYEDSIKRGNREDPNHQSAKQWVMLESVSDPDMCFHMVIPGTKNSKSYGFISKCDSDYNPSSKLFKFITDEESNKFGQIQVKKRTDVNPSYHGCITREVIKDQPEKKPGEGNLYEIIRDNSTVLPTNKPGMYRVQTSDGNYEEYNWNPYSSDCNDKNWGIFLECPGDKPEYAIDCDHKSGFWECKSGRYGTRCEKIECDPKDLETCQNCTTKCNEKTGKYNCKSGWSGDNCSVKDVEDVDAGDVEDVDTGNTEDVDTEDDNTGNTEDVDTGDGEDVDTGDGEDVDTGDGEDVDTGEDDKSGNKDNDVKIYLLIGLLLLGAIIAMLVLYKLFTR